MAERWWLAVQIYVSKHIYAAGDSALAQECYGQLYKAGATIHLSPWYCTLLPPILLASICMYIYVWARTL